MSRMLEALQNLSSRPAESPTADEPVALSPEAEAPTAQADPVLPPADHTRRMKELLNKYLATPKTPAEMLQSLKAEISEHPIDEGVLGNMTVPIPSGSRSPARPTLPAMRLNADDEPDAEPSVRESISVTFPMSEVGPIASPSISVGLASIDRMEELLATIGEAESPEEVAVSFGGEEREQGSEDRGQAEESETVQEEERGQKSEVRGEEEAAEVSVSEFRAPEAEVEKPTPPANLESPTPPHPHTLTPEPAPEPAIVLETPSFPLNPEPQTLNPSAAASPLDHLADARPLVEYRPEEEAPPPVPAPQAKPPRTISRSRTRLEQRVTEGLAHASRSVPYRELADRLAQDLRLLSGRCLLFAGIGPASHGDDLLAHLAALMAEDDAEVLVVDADFTRAGVTVGLGALKETGLGDLLEHAGRGEELILPTLLPNVSLLPAGRKALPDSLGVVDHLAQLLAKLEERFALILIDGGIHTHALSPSLARLCDATYFVVRLGATDARTATTALKAYRGSGARVMGCVATTAS